MSPEETSQIEMGLRLDFRDSETALAAALSEVRNAAASLDAAEAARAEFGDCLTVAEAVRQLAIKRGQLWLAFNPARHGSSHPCHLIEPSSGGSPCAPLSRTTPAE